MLPGSGCECWSRWMMSRVSPCVGRGNDHAAASACALGPAGPSGARSALPHQPHPGQPPHYPPAWEQELVRVADLDPHEVGVDSALWTCRLLADYLAEQTGHQAGIDTVRVALHRAGFVCKRPRWVLTRKAHAQPGWAKNA